MQQEEIFNKIFQNFLELKDSKVSRFQSPNTMGKKRPTPEHIVKFWNTKDKKTILQDLGKGSLLHIKKKKNQEPKSLGFSMPTPIARKNIMEQCLQNCYEKFPT